MSSKKRKQSPSRCDDEIGKMQDERNIASLLFEEMSAVNSKLIFIGKNITLLDNSYFTTTANNNIMIDEFIGNMNQFLKQLQDHRKKVAFASINSDVLSHIYQFLKSRFLITCCGLVCKLWRESLIGLKVKVSDKNLDSFLHSSIVNQVTELVFNADIAESFMTLSNFNLNKLKVLDLSDNNLQMECIEHLKKCDMPNLTELKLCESQINEKDAIELFNSNFISTVKKLDLSYAVQNFTNNFYESVSTSKHLSQITHLKICNRTKQIGKTIDIFLKDKRNLEELEIVYYELGSNFLAMGHYLNLTCLHIDTCCIKNQDLANLFISPNLPNLKTIKVDHMNEWMIDNTITVFPPNSHSSITELDFCYFIPEHFSSLFDHCKQLKKLSIYPKITTCESYIAFQNMLKSPNLSNLEVLYLTYSNIVEDIFINPIYSNLKELIFETDSSLENVDFIFNCTNLINLTQLDLSLVDVDKQSLIEECSNAIRQNVTFSKLKQFNPPTYNALSDSSDD